MSPQPAIPPISYVTPLQFSKGQQLCSSQIISCQIVSYEINYSTTRSEGCFIVLIISYSICCSSDK